MDLLHNGKIRFIISVPGGVCACLAKFSHCITHFEEKSVKAAVDQKGVRFRKAGKLLAEYKEPKK